jgi:hypothetical protein
VQQSLRATRQETVVDEEVLFDGQLRVATFQIARAVTAHAMAQRQILCARGRPNRVRLDETQLLNGLGKRGGKQRAGHGVATQVVDRENRYAAGRTHWPSIQVAAASSPR